MVTKRSFAVAAMCLILIHSTGVAWALCNDISGKTLTTNMMRWRTFSGSDQAWVNNLFDGQVGEPTHPKFQEIGFLPSGTTWNSQTVATVQDSSDSECDQVTMKFEMYSYNGSATCTFPQQELFTSSWTANTCAMPGGSIRFFAQETVAVFGLGFKPSYSPWSYISRWVGYWAHSSEPGGVTPCVRLSAVSTGCN